MNKHQIEGGQKSPRLGFGISVQHGPCFESLGIAPEIYVVGLRCMTDYLEYCIGPGALDLYSNQQQDF